MLTDGGHGALRLCSYGNVTPPPTAAALYRRALFERPNASWIYRNLASTLSGSGRIDEAKLAFAEMLRSYPDLTISKYKQAMVFSGTTLDRMAENLRKLGLPD